MHVGVLLVLAVYAGIPLRRQIETAKTARRKAEDEDAPNTAEAAKTFGRLHGVSMLVNLALMLGTGALLWRWAGRMGSGG